MGLDKPLLTVDDLAKFLKMSRVNIYRLVKNGVLPAKWIGGSIRFKPEVIEKFIAGAEYDPAEHYADDTVVKEEKPESKPSRSKPKHRRSK